MTKPESNSRDLRYRTIFPHNINSIFLICEICIAEKLFFSREKFSMNFSDKSELRTTLPVWTITFRKRKTQNNFAFYMKNA